MRLRDRKARILDAEVTNKRDHRDNQRDRKERGVWCRRLLRASKERDVARTKRVGV